MCGLPYQCSQVWHVNKCAFIITGMHVNFDSNYSCQGSIKQNPLGSFARTNKIHMPYLLYLIPVLAFAVINNLLTYRSQKICTETIGLRCQSI